MMWPALIVSVALTAVQPPVCSGEGGKSRTTSAALFNWWVNPGRLIYVAVMPTPLALALGLDPKSITLTPVRTRDDPNPASIEPFKSERTRYWSLQAWFKPIERRFTLTVTLADGSTYTLDPWREPCPGGSKKYEAGPYRGIAPEVKRG